MQDEIRSAECTLDFGVTWPTFCRSRFWQANTIVLPSILWAKSKKTG